MDKDKIYYKKLLFKLKYFSNKFFKGIYKSNFKGEGIDFVENRDYIFGDSSKHINWNLWAKYNKPFTKIYEDERGEYNLILLDASSSMFFKTNEKSKYEIAQEISILLLYVFSTCNDKFSFLCFSDRIERFFPFEKGENYFYLIYNFLINLNLRNSKKSILSEVLIYLYKILKKKTNIFIISDFITNNNDKLIENLKILESKHKIILLQILDSFELKNDSIINFGKSIEGENNVFFENQSFYIFNLNKLLSQNFRYYLMLTNTENIYFELKNFFEKKLK